MMKTVLLGGITMVALVDTIIRFFVRIVKAIFGGKSE